MTIFARAGYSQWLSLLVLIPLAGLPIVLFILAVRKWPIQREVSELRIRCGSGNKEDAYFLLSEGIRFEVKGKYEEAQALWFDPDSKGFCR